MGRCHLAARMSPDPPYGDLGVCLTLTSRGQVHSVVVMDALQARKIPKRADE
jgi:hypothetical protein